MVAYYLRNVSHASTINARIQAVRINFCNTPHLLIDEFGANICCLVKRKVDAENLQLNKECMDRHILYVLPMGGA